MNKFFKKVRNSFYPPKCPVCGEKVMEDTKFCGTCQNRVERVPLMACQNCGRAFEHCMCDINQAGDYFKTAGVFYYNDEMKRAVANLKFKKDTSGARFFAGEMSERVKEAFNGDEFDVIIPVPLGPVRYKQRGFNQCDLLAKGMSEDLKVPEDKKSVKKWLETKAQSSLPGDRRRENIQGVFKVENKDDIKDKRVLLVDDVVTTKSTANEIARTIMDAGAENVHILALCVTKIVYKYERRNSAHKREID